MNHTLKHYCIKVIMTFITRMKETIIMKFGGLLMRISIHIGVRNGFRLDHGLRGSGLILEQNSQYSVLRCASQDHC